MVVLSFSRLCVCRNSWNHRPKRVSYTELSLNEQVNAIGDIYKPLINIRTTYKFINGRGSASGQQGAVSARGRDDAAGPQSIFPRLLTVRPTESNNLTLEKPGGPARGLADVMSAASMATASLLRYSSQRCTICTRHKRATHDAAAKGSLQNWPGLLKNVDVLRGWPRRRQTEEA